MENDFDYKLVPSGFVHCFNSQCPKADGCLRQVAARYSAHADRHVRTSSLRRKCALHGVLRTCWKKSLIGRHGICGK